MRGLKKVSRQKNKLFFLSANSNFTNVSFCSPRTFPKTRKAIARLGLNYENLISGGLQKLCQEFNARNFNPNGNFCVFPPPVPIEILSLISIDINDSRGNFLISRGNISSGNVSTNAPSGNFLSPNHFFHIFFCHNPWIKYQIPGENFFRFCCPDFIVFISKFIPSGNFLNKHSREDFLFFSQINNQNLPLALSGQMLNPSGNFLFHNLDSIIIIEAKLSYVEISHQKLFSLYSPLVEIIFKSKNITPKNLVICKNLTPQSPKAFGSISSALNSISPFHLCQWLGNGKLKL